MWCSVWDDGWDGWSRVLVLYKCMDVFDRFLSVEYVGVMCMKFVKLVVGVFN